MNVLDEIVSTKRLEIEASKSARPLERLQEDAANHMPHRRPFLELFAVPDKTVLIAEIKPKSPSAGELISHSPLDVADLYAKSEADVISVLTDKTYFGGDIELLKAVRARVPQAVFRKDFIIDEYQIYETALAGADAFLLIANILTADQLSAFAELGNSFGMGSLVEVHDEADLEKALAAKAAIIGINNRDLRTMEVDLSTTEKLTRKIPPEIPVVSESGIATPEDVQRVRKAGARGILVGTSILQSADPVATIAKLKRALV